MNQYILARNVRHYNNKNNGHAETREQLKWLLPVHRKISFKIAIKTKIFLSTPLNVLLDLYFSNLITKQ